MDVKPSITRARQHSAQLRQLTTDLRQELSKLRLALDEQAGGSDPEELRLLADLAEVNSNLLAIFYQRLHRFLEGQQNP